MRTAVLALALLLPLPAMAGYVIHDQPGIVAHSHLNCILDSDGHVWEFNTNNEIDWIRRADWDPPVSLEQLKFWDLNTLVTMDERMLYVPNSNPQNGWHDAGSWPASGLPSDGAPSTRRASTVPNPSSRSSRITFSIATAGPVSVRIFDATGRLVRTVLEGDLPAGDASVTWDGRNEQSEAVPAGVYFSRVETPHAVIAGKIDRR
ncbi:MAG: T9SS type A sorting domain-containing protein [Candidatus Eisenbacteria bacterium]|nr:T9SS type A sorting domain-containing protein [Candidatus Eisenbacteria bacterium]